MVGAKLAPRVVLNALLGAIQNVITAQLVITILQMDLVVIVELAIHLMVVKAGKQIALPALMQIVSVVVRLELESVQNAVQDTVGSIINAKYVRMLTAKHVVLKAQDLVLLA